MGSTTSASHETVVRRCGQCAATLTVTPEDTLYCARCARCVRKWTVEMNGQVVGAGCVANGSHAGQIWLSRGLARLRVKDFVERLRIPATSRSGWTEETWRPLDDRQERTGREQEG